MAKQKSTFAKLQRDRAKAAKKAEREAARAAAKAGISPEDAEAAVEEVAPNLEDLSTVERLFHGKGDLSAPELMAMVEEVSSLKQRGQLTEDEFEEAKLEIMERLSA